VRKKKKRLKLEAEENDKEEQNKGMEQLHSGFSLFLFSMTFEEIGNKRTATVHNYSLYIYL